MLKWIAFWTAARSESGNLEWGWKVSELARHMGHGIPLVCELRRLAMRVAIHFAQKRWLHSVVMAVCKGCVSVQMGHANEVHELSMNPCIVAAYCTLGVFMVRTALNICLVTDKLVLGIGELRMVRGMNMWLGGKSGWRWLLVIGTSSPSSIWKSSAENSG